MTESGPSAAPPRAIAPYPILQQIPDPWLVAGDAFNDALIAAAQLDDVMIRVTDENGNLTLFAEADGSLRDCDIVLLESADGRWNTRNAQRHMRVARIFARHVHQNIRVTLAGIGVDDQVELDAVVVSLIATSSPFARCKKPEPQDAIEFERAIEITTRMPM